MLLDYNSDEIEMTNQHEATSKKLVWWILSTMGVVLLAVIGSWASTQASSVEDHTKRIEQVEKTEAVHTSQFEDVKQDLQEISKKVDHIIENQERRK